MGMTHYMELMMSSWYLLVLFMALPMFLAECYVVSEILLLLKGADSCPRLKVFNKASAYASAVVILGLAVIAGAYFLGVTGWRTWVDVTAAVAYVLAGLPFLYVAAVEAGFIAKAKEKVAKGVACVIAVVCYLVLSHAAMVFGMFDPMQFGYQPADGGMGHMMMHDGASHTMHHGKMDHSMHEVPAGHHMMPDGTIMKNGEMMSKPTDKGAEGHMCH